MKKYVVLFAFMTSCICSYSQVNRHTVCDSIDSKEAVVLNILASKHGIEYDFSSKKVAFFSGSGGGARKSKEHFLSIYRNVDDNYDATSYFSPRIYIFNKEEKTRADGYDAVIVYGSVKQFPTKRTLIRRLHNQKYWRWRNML